MDLQLFAYRLRFLFALAHESRWTFLIASLLLGAGGVGYVLRGMNAATIISLALTVPALGLAAAGAYQNRIALLRGAIRLHRSGPYALYLVELLHRQVAALLGRREQVITERLAAVCRAIERLDTEAKRFAEVTESYQSEASVVNTRGHLARARETLSEDQHALACAKECAHARLISIEAGCNSLKAKRTLAEIESSAMDGICEQVEELEQIEEILDSFDQTTEPRAKLPPA